MTTTIAGTSFDRVAALDTMLSAAAGAAKIVMRVYATPFGVDYKGKDDPVTVADHEANAFLCDALSRAFPGIPIVAEESDPKTFAGFERAPAAFFVDPLDGTREFVAKNGEFAVMLGLAERGRATAGVVVCPASARTFAGIVGRGAFEAMGDGSRRPIRVSNVASLADAAVVVSRSRRSDELERVVAAACPRCVTPTGSSGVKAARIAVAEADVYLQLGNAGKRWDACAPEAIVNAAGGKMTDARGQAFDYASGEIENAHGLVATNAALYDDVMKVVLAERGRAR